MGDNAIYFPYINVPSDIWFFRVLLYWDKVSSIVPYDHICNPDRLSPHMRNLLTAELVEQIPPSNYLYKIPHFEDAFLNYICFQNSRRNRNPTLHLQRRNRFSIHMEKMGRIADELVKLGFAQRSGYPWYEVDDWVASAFMCYLASSLGKLDEINASPVTNEWNSSLMFKRNIFHFKVNENVKRNKIRQLLLKNLLPGPSELPDIDGLINFKLSHGKALSKLRNTIEGYCIEMSNIRNDEAREERVNSLLQDIEDDVQEISETMKSKWKRITFRTLMPILGAGAAMLSENPLQNPVAISAAGLSFASAVYEAFQGVKEYEKILNKPLAYVAFARATFM